MTLFLGVLNEVENALRYFRDQLPGLKLTTALDGAKEDCLKDIKILVEIQKLVRTRIMEKRNNQ